MYISLSLQKCKIRLVYIIVVTDNSTNRLSKKYLRFSVEDATTDKDEKSSRQVDEPLHEEEADFISKDPEMKEESNEEVPIEYISVIAH